MGNPCKRVTHSVGSHVHEKSKNVKREVETPRKILHEKKECNTLTLT